MNLGFTFVHRSSTVVIYNFAANFFRMRLGIALLAGLVVVLFTGAVPAIAAQTGPIITVTPSSIVTGGTVTITLTTGTPATSNDYSCTSPEFQYYDISEISVNTPQGDSWQLGSATASGFAGSPEGGNAPQIQVMSGDTFTIPFGPTAFPILVAGNTYYWWLNFVGQPTPGHGTTSPGDRLDAGYPHQTGDPMPTTESGTYVLDISGNTYCSQGDSAHPFTAALWFDLPFNVTCCNKFPPPVPEFPVGLGAVLAASMLGLVLLRKRLF